MVSKNNKLQLFKHSALWVVFLAIFWLLLSGYFAPLLLSFGAISIAIVVYLLNRMNLVDGQTPSIGQIVKAVRYVPWLFRQIFISSINVTKLIWGNPSKVSPALKKISVKNVPVASRAYYANSITLTPGTLSVDLVDDEITVHALQASSIDELQQGTMEQKITNIWGENK